MNYTAIVRVISILGLVMAGALAIGGAVALIFREWVQLGAFGIAIFIVVVLSTSILLLTSRPTRKANPKDGLAVLVLWWLLASIVGAIPFIFDAPQGAVTAVLHESVSSLTTTGHVVLSPGEGEAAIWPVSLIVWRGLLHILGAMASLIAAATLFAALNLGGPGIHRTVLFTIPEGSFFSATPKVVVAAGLALGTVIFTTAALLLASGVPAAMALGDAVSVATTGLVVPGREDIAPLGILHALIIGGGLLVSTIGLAVALEIWGGRWRGAFRDPEASALLITILVVGGFAMVAGYTAWQGFGLGLTHISTSGLPLSTRDVAHSAPVTLMVIPALIGGSALSTAGGLKLARVALLMGRAGEEFARLGFRDSVVVMRYRGRVLPDAAIIGVWVYLVAYISALALLLLLTAICHLPFDTSVKTSVGWLSNTGSLVELDTVYRPQLADIVGIFAMLLGRLEVIALIPVFSWGFWRA
ncbi:MAG: hypothetical protein MRY64_12970 [Hyphomonadaceae bacterium]|nr:hypothetical protein [Hyphomonadaceae bacterium]